MTRNDRRFTRANRPLRFSLPSVVCMSIASVAALWSCLFNSAALAQESTGDEGAAFTVQTSPANPTSPVGSSERLFRITTNVTNTSRLPSAASADDAQEQVFGRILIEAQNGGLLVEEPNGKLRILKADSIAEKQSLESLFEPLTADDLGRDLLQQCPPGFEIYQTEHYVICSNTTEQYALFCGKLLERVYEQYFVFMKEHEIVVTPPRAKLPLIILHSASEFQEFAERQNPGRTFKDSPGYYSIMDNQTLVMDLTKDRSVRNISEIRKQLSEQPLQVATIVHEAVHQLAFNTGLQVRLADNPVWLSEGLAVYFEQTTPRSSTLWSKPGLVNSRLHPIFQSSVTSKKLQIPLQLLISTDQPFLEQATVASAYAESWGLVSWLFRQRKSGMKLYLSSVSQHKPLKAMTPQERVQEFEAAFESTPEELEASVINYVNGLRAHR